MFPREPEWLLRELVRMVGVSVRRAARAESHDDEGDLRRVGSNEAGLRTGMVGPLAKFIRGSEGLGLPQAPHVKAVENYNAPLIHDIRLYAFARKYL